MQVYSLCASALSPSSLFSVSLVAFSSFYFVLTALHLISLGASLSHLSAVNKEALCRCVHPSITILTGTSPPRISRVRYGDLLSYALRVKEEEEALEQPLSACWKQSAIAADQYVVRTISGSLALICFRRIGLKYQGSKQ